MADQKELRKLFRDSARGGHPDGNIIFLDPNRFNGDQAHDRKAALEIYVEQLNADPASFRHGARLDPSNKSDMAWFRSFSGLAMNGRDPGARLIKPGFCLMKEPKDYKELYASYLDMEHMPKQQWLTPSKIEHYVTYWGGA